MKGMVAAVAGKEAFNWGGMFYLDGGLIGSAGNGQFFVGLEFLDWYLLFDADGWFYWAD